MPASIDINSFAQMKHFADAGDMRAKAVIGILEGTFTSAMTKGVGVAGHVATSGNVAFANLPTTTLVVKISTNGGSTFPTTRTHTFGAGPFANIDAVIADIAADTAFLGGVTPDIALSKSVAELILTIVGTGGLSGKVLKVDATSTGIAGAGLLEFSADQLSIGGGVRLSFQMVNQAGIKLKSVKDLIVRALAVAGTATFIIGVAGTIKKGSGTAEVWCQTSAAGLLELIFSDVTSEDVFVLAQTDNGEIELNKITMPLP